MSLPAGTPAGADSTFDATVAAFNAVLGGGEEERRSAAEDSADEAPEGEAEGIDTESGEDQAPEDTEQQEEEKGDEPAQTFKVKVDGQEVEVTLPELLQGYQRTADYTRKTQALAEQRRTMEAELAEVKQGRTQYAEKLRLLDTVLQASMPAVPNWDELKLTDPLTYTVKWTEHQQKMEQLRGLQAEMQRVQAEQQRQQEAELQRILAEEKAKLAEVIPEWGDQKKAAAEKQALKEYGLSVGFSADELEELFDHRAVRVLREAWLYNQIKQRAQATRQTGAARGAAPAAVPPTVTRPARQVSDITRAKQRLAKTGRVEHAAAAFELML